MQGSGGKRGRGEWQVRISRFVVGRTLLSDGDQSRPTAGVGQECPTHLREVYANSEL
jgi:hypothetical protein